MQVNIQELAKSAGLDTGHLYPGKREVKSFRVPGQYKSHSLVLDWRVPENLRIELKAGLTGQTLDPKELKKYPVSYQALTYLDIAIDADQNIADEDEDEEDKERGKSGSTGGGPKSKALDDLKISLNAFDKVTDGQIASIGEIKKFVVMGKELAKESFASAYENLCTQMQQTKIMTMDIMKAAGNVIQKAMPGGGLKAKGGESIPYQYDEEKTGPMFGAVSPG